VLEYKVPPPVGLDGYGGVEGTIETSALAGDGRAKSEGSSLVEHSEETRAKAQTEGGKETGVRKPF